MSASTDKIYSLCSELRFRVGELQPSEFRTAYGQLLTELLNTAANRLSEETYMDAEKSRSRCD